MNLRIYTPVLETSYELRMIPHMPHSFLLHNWSLVFLSPKVHALSVPWKKRPEVMAPPPTSALTHMLVTLGQKCPETIGPRACDAYLYMW